VAICRLKPRATDIRHGRSKAYRSTLTMPAWVLISVIGMVLPSVNGTMVPPGPATSFSTIAPVRMRSPSPASSRW